MEGLLMITTYSMRWPTNNISMLNKSFIIWKSLDSKVSSLHFLTVGYFYSNIIYIICTQWVKEKSICTNQNKDQRKLNIREKFSVRLQSANHFNKKTRGYAVQYKMEQLICREFHNFKKQKYFSDHYYLFQ